MNFIVETVMILNFHFLTLFSFDFIDQTSLKLSGNPIICTICIHIWIIWTIWIYSNSFLKSKYYSYLYLFHFQKTNTIHIHFKITIRSNSGLSVSPSVTKTLAKSQPISAKMPSSSCQSAILPLSHFDFTCYLTLGNMFLVPGVK